MSISMDRTDSKATREKPVAPRGPGSRASNGSPGTRRAEMQELKTRIHRRLLERLNLSSLDMVDRDEAERVIGEVTQELLVWENFPLNKKERDVLVGQILDEIFGLGPLEPLMQDPEITDILVNSYDQVYVEKYGTLHPTDVRFQDNRHLLQVIDRIVSAVGRRIDDSSPMVDARLPDNSRVNAVIPPLAVDGPHVSIRRFKRDKLTGENLIEVGALNEAMLELLSAVVKARLNVMVSGGTGAGKTTMLNILSGQIPDKERIITIEDVAELQLQQPHTVRLETRPANVEGRGEVTQRMLVANALRMRPDRIVVGEVRGAESVDMLQAMNTGHDGSLTTLHANSPRDALVRLETLVAMANLNLPPKAVRHQIASALDVVIQLSRLSDGSRKVMAISEVSGMEGEVITMQELFEFELQGIGEDGSVLGRFRPTGVRPRFSDKLAAAGIDLGGLLFFEDAASHEATGPGEASNEGTGPGWASNEVTGPGW